MTLIHKLNLMILKMCLHTKNKLSRSRYSTFRALQTDAQTDRQRERCDKTYSRVQVTTDIRHSIRCYTLLQYCELPSVDSYTASLSLYPLLTDTVQAAAVANYLTVTHTEVIHKYS